MSCCVVSLLWMQMLRLNIQLPKPLKAKLNAERKRGTSAAGLIRLSREEVLQNIFDVQMTPLQRAKVLQQAEARGCTWQDLFRDLFKHYDTMMEDPIQREARLRTHEEMERRRAMPFGSDPLREQAGDA